MLCYSLLGCYPSVLWCFTYYQGVTLAVSYVFAQPGAFSGASSIHRVLPQRSVVLAPLQGATLGFSGAFSTTGVLPLRFVVLFQH